jgi:exosortase/archaeosortase family protein
MPLSERRKFYKPIPSLNKELLFFFLKLVALVILWQCSYSFILKPSGIPDKQLTNIITSGVTHCINFSSPSSSVYTWVRYKGIDYDSDAIFKNGKIVFVIADICNGLSLMAIYVGFIILMPYPFKRKIIFSVIGMIVLTIANIVRCGLLYWIYRRHPDMFDFNHHYTFTILMYLLIFYGWILFTKGGKINEAR